MAQVKFMVVERDKEKNKTYHVVTANFQSKSMRGVFRKAKELSKKYATKWYYAEVYVYDPTKKEEDYTIEKMWSSKLE
jgi:hypothetical protein